MNIFSKLFGAKKQETPANNSNLIEDCTVFDVPEPQTIEFTGTESENHVSSQQERYKQHNHSAPQDIPDAIQYIVETLGRDSICTRSFINVLNDFQLLKGKTAVKNVLLNMLDGGYIQKILAISNWELESRSIIKQFSNDFGAKDEIVTYVVKSLGYGLRKNEEKPSAVDFETISLNPELEVITDNANHPELELVNVGTVTLEPYDPKRDLENYHYPTLDLLKYYEEDGKPYIDMAEQTANKNRIAEVLRTFGIEISSIKATVGPAITLYEITPAPGMRISKFRGLEEDIALYLKPQGVRIIAPIPGKATIGIEVPNDKIMTVSMERVLNSRKYQETVMELPCAIGKTVTNEVFMFDLAKAPHLLIAGATGQGKSIGVYAILTSLLYKKHPAEMKLVLADPKKVELSFFRKIDRHFLAALPEDFENPIISDTAKMIRTLQSLCVEMDARYELLMEAEVRNIKEYNSKFISRQLNPERGHKFMPYIVMFIDEYGDFMVTGGLEIELPLARIAQKGRAVGLHMILTTQRPIPNIITNSIKVNCPTRIAFRVSQKKDSMTIIDRLGAENLNGNGDLLFLSGTDPVRVQCAFVDTSEVIAVNNYIACQEGYIEPFELPEPFAETRNTKDDDVDLNHLDPMFDDAARLIVSSGSGSTSIIQRKFSIGYNRAGRLMDMLEKAGIVGQAHGSKPREVLIKNERSLERLLASLHK